MERPIRTDVILEDDEVLAERPEDEMSIPQDIEIEIEPDVDEDGNTIISFGEELPESTSDDFYGNLAEEMDQRDLSSLASDILAMYSEDRESRSGNGRIAKGWGCSEWTRLIDQCPFKELLAFIILCFLRLLHNFNHRPIKNFYPPEAL